jgi:hypothetical protein
MTEKKKFGEMRAYPGMNGFSISEGDPEMERILREAEAEEEKQTRYEENRERMIKSAQDRAIHRMEGIARDLQNRSEEIMRAVKRAKERPEELETWMADVVSELDNFTPHTQMLFYALRDIREMRAVEMPED